MLIPVFILFITPMPAWIINKDNIFSLINNYNIGIATAIFIIAVITDKLDGYIARKYNQVTKLGCFLDPLADKLLIISALMFLVEENKIGGWIALIIIGREIAVTGLRLAAAINNKVLSADKYGKIKLVFQAITIPLYLLNNYHFNIIERFSLDSVMMFFTVIITIYSGINYFIKNKDVFLDSGKLII